MTELITLPPGQLPPAQQQPNQYEIPTTESIEWGRLSELETLRNGAEHNDIPANHTLYPPENIGIISEETGENGVADTTYNVVADLAIPHGKIIASNGREKSKFGHFVVVSKTQDGKSSFALRGLVANERTGRMEVDPSAQPVWIPEEGELVIGRNNPRLASELWAGGSYTQDVSRQHLTFKINEAGRLDIKNTGRFGSWGEFAKMSQTEKLFEPVRPKKGAKTVTAASSAESSYDELFRNVHIASGEDWEAPDYGWPVTESTRRDAIGALGGSLAEDNKLAEIVCRFGDIINIKDIGSIVDAIRTNPQVRLAVGEYYLGRVRSASNIKGYLPSRVEANTGKSTTRRLTNLGTSINSQEYVALLCLAKLDGTYDRMSVRSTDVYIPGKDGGQHGLAASLFVR